MNNIFKKFNIKNTLIISMLAFMSLNFGCDTAGKTPSLTGPGEDISAPPLPSVPPERQQAKNSKVVNFLNKMLPYYFGYATSAEIKKEFDGLSDDEIRNTTYYNVITHNMMHMLLMHEINSDILSIFKRYVAVLGNFEAKKMLAAKTSLGKVPADMLKLDGSLEQQEIEKIIESQMPTQAEKFAASNIARNLASDTTGDVAKKIDKMDKKAVKSLAAQFAQGRDKETFLKNVLGSQASAETKSVFVEQYNKGIVNKIDQHLILQKNQYDLQAFKVFKVEFIENMEKNKISMKSVFEKAYQNTGNTLVQLLVSLPMTAENYEIILTIQKYYPEDFVYQLFGDINSGNILQEILKNGRLNDDSRYVSKLINLLIDTASKSGKKDKIVVDKDNFKRLLVATKDDLENLKIVFRKGIAIEAQAREAFRWIGENVEISTVRQLFNWQYQAVKDEPNRKLARSIVLVGMKEQFGVTDKKFIKEMEKYAEELGLGDANTLKELTFNIGQITEDKPNPASPEIPGQPRSAKFSEIQSIVTFLPSKKFNEFAVPARENQTAVTAQELLLATVRVNPKVTGFINKGGYSCFLSAITQTILHTPEINRFLTYYEDNPVITKDKHPVLSSLFELVKLYRNAQGPFVPTEWINVALGSTGIGHCQSDASEFFTTLVDRISEEMNVAGPGVAPYPLKDHELSDLSFVETYTRARKFSLIDKWMSGYIRKETVKKETGKEDVTQVSYQAIDGLDLKFPEGDAKNLSLKDLIDNYSTEDPDTHIKSFLAVAPKILRITLLRFKDGKKNQAPVNYPAKLPLSEFKLEGQETYELYSVIQHHGDVGGGHYVVDIKTGDKESVEQWYHLNDLGGGKEVKIDEATALSKTTEASMLFYRLRD